MKYFPTHNVIQVYIRRLVLIVAFAVSASVLFTAPVSAATFNITTDFPSTVGSVYSTLTGYVVNSGGEDLTVWFEYGQKGSFDASTSKFNVQETRSLSAHIYRLEKGVQYQYRAVARKTSSGDTVYGETRVFTVSAARSSTSQTTSDPDSNGSDGGDSTNTSLGSGPVVNSDAGDVTATENTLTLRGDVVTGGVPTAAWFEWGTTPSFGNKTEPQTLPQTSTTVSFEETISGLTPDTTYYYQLVSINEQGVSRSNLTSTKTKGGGLFDGFGSGTDTNSTANDGGFSFGNTSGSNGSQDTSGDDLPFSSSLGSDTKVQSGSGALSWGEILQSELFTIDERGNVYTSQHSFSFGDEQSRPGVLASVFSLGDGLGLLPNSFAGWALWIILVFVVIFQLRSVAAKRAKRKAEKELREQELGEIRRYQEAAGKAKKTA